MAGLFDLASVIPGLINAGIKNKWANRELDEASKYRTDAQNVQKQALRPEYQNALNAADIQAAQGNPELQTDLSQVGVNAANAGRTILETSPDGASSLNAITAALVAGNQQKAGLLGQSATMRQNNQRYAEQTLWNVGDKQRDLELQQRDDRNMLLSEATNEENAGIGNKFKAADEATKFATKGVDDIDASAVQTAPLIAQISAMKSANSDAAKNGQPPVYDDKAMSLANFNMGSTLAFGAGTTPIQQTAGIKKSSDISFTDKNGGVNDSLDVSTLTPAQRAAYLQFLIQNTK